MQNKFEKLVIGSKNQAKVERYSSVLSGYALQLIGLFELAISEKPQESGLSAEENAQIKGRFYSERTGLPVFSEDESLYVDFLSPEEQPGTHVRRIFGDEREATDSELLAHWNALIKNTHPEKRTGKWRIAYCVALPNGTTNTVVLEHPVKFFSPASHIVIPGWPMNSIQGPAMFNKPESELTPHEKAQLHDAADQMIAQKVRELLSM